MNLFHVESFLPSGYRRGAKRSWREADTSLPSSAEVKNACRHT